MSRHIRIAATAAIALSLLLAPSMAMADDKPDQAGAAGNAQGAPADLKDVAYEVYSQMKAARETCDIAGYTAARAHLVGLIQLLGRTAKAAKKLGKFAKNDPGQLFLTANLLQILMEAVDKKPWGGCREPAKDNGHSYVPSPRADPPDWAIALAGQQAGAIHDGFDRPGAGSFDGISMVDRAMRAAHGGMGDARFPDCDEGGDMPGGRRADPRFPSGFGAFMPGGPGRGGFGGWGWGR